MKPGQRTFVKEVITLKLLRRFSPAHLDVVNESHRHRSVPAGAETHFRVQLVSDAFEGLATIARHRLVYECLDAELKAGVHALALDCRTKGQWASSPGFATPEIPCRGKKGKD